MASTLQGGGAWLLLCAVAALAAMAQAQQAGAFPNFAIGRCPSYQTQSDFSQEYIDSLKDVQDGFILILSDGSADTCQRLKFLDEDTFKFSYSDEYSRPRVYSSIYTATPGNLTQPAQLSLSMVTGMLGADILGRLSLIPLVVRSDLLVMTSCVQIGAFKNEQLLAFVPYPNTADVLGIKEELVSLSIPNAARLATMSLECSPVSLRNTQPLGLRFYNLISGINNPARQTINAANSIRTSSGANGDRGSFRSGLVTDQSGNAVIQESDNQVPFYSGNFEVPVFYNAQQPFVSTFNPSNPVPVTYYSHQAPVPTYTAAAHGVPASSSFQAKFPNGIYTQFYP